MFILITEINNILNFNMLTFNLWVLYTFLDKDKKMYT
jgi:hypothetical protein